MSAAQYARLVPKKYRSRTLPKVDRPWRPRVIAWAGPAAFYPNRFYEIDKWYKARIDKPEKLPEMHIIDPADHMKSLNELMKKPEIEQINIGFKKREEAVKAEKSEKDRVELERKSRHTQLKIDIDSLSFENLSIYRHFQVFDHLFGENIFFENVQKLEVNYSDNMVHNGNVLSANSTVTRPEIDIESVGNGKGFNTILMVNLDGNGFSEEKNGELIHWMVSNIPDGESIEKGNELIDYLQPLPFYGTGYHRVAFVLFRHSEKVDFKVDGSSLESRIQSISDLYKSHENVITPSAIRFLQTSYDNSVKTALHKLGLKSPLYNYEFTPALKPAQREFPEKPQPFDLYLDMYRDPKEVEKEMLEKRLSEIQLNNVEEPEWIDPDYVENKKKLPAWLHAKILERKGVGHAKYHNDVQ